MLSRAHTSHAITFPRSICLSMDSRLRPRQSASLFFDSIAFYTFSNALSPNNTLSSGIHQSASGALNMTTMTSFSSSENWQLYFQSNRYFIRNYDYGADWQLGLSDNSRSVPRLLPRSGELGQQWIVSRNADGTWRFANGLLGNESVMALSRGNTVPGMNPSERGGKWEVAINPSAGEPQDADMLVDVKGFETPSPTATPTAVVTASSTIITSSVAAKTNEMALSIGAIVGIAIGALALLAVLAGAAYFFWARRRKKPAEMDARGFPMRQPVGNQGNGRMEEGKEIYAHQAYELGGGHYAPKEKTQRHELG